VSALFIPVAALLVLVYELVLARRSLGRRAELVSQALYWLLGASVPLAVWLAVIFIPHRETYLAYVVHHSFGAKAGHPTGVGAYLLNAFSVGSFSKLYDRLPVVAALGFAALPAWSAAPAAPQSSPRSSSWRASRCSATATITLTATSLFSLIPLMAGFAFAVDRLLEREIRIGHPWPHPGGMLCYGLWLWPLAAQMTFRLAGRRGGTNSALITALVAAQVVSFGLWRLHRATHGGIRLQGSCCGPASLLPYFYWRSALDIKLYAGWYGTRTHLMYDCSRDLDKALPDSSVTGGFWAPACSRHRTSTRSSSAISGA